MSDETDKPWAPPVPPWTPSEEPMRRRGLLHEAFSVAGGVAFLCLGTITAAALSANTPGPFDPSPFFVIWPIVALVTFRAFSRDEVKSGWKARLKRGALFAFPFLLGLPLLGLIALLLFPHHISSSAMGRLVADLMILSPTAFGVGVLTSK